MNIKVNCNYEEFLVNKLDGAIYLLGKFPKKVMYETIAHLEQVSNKHCIFFGSFAENWFIFNMCIKKKLFFDISCLMFKLHR